MSYPNEAYAAEANAALKQSGGQQYIGGGMLGAGSAAGQLATPTVSAVLAELMQSAEALSSRVTKLADRLCGPINVSSGEKDASKQSDGMLNSMKDNSYVVMSRIRQAQEALDRIEALL